MEISEKIRVMIVDDHPVVCDGLQAILRRQRDMIVVATARDGQEAVELFREHRPDVTVLDLRMPLMCGVDAITEIRKINDRARILVLTVLAGDHDVYRALRAGAAGYLLKDCPREELLHGVRAVYDGKTPMAGTITARLASHVDRPALTTREHEILKAIAAGRTNRAIATALGIGEGTVKTHVNHIMQKLKATSRTEALRRGIEAGLVHVD